MRALACAAVITGAACAPATELAAPVSRRVVATPVPTPDPTPKPTPDPTPAPRTPSPRPEPMHANAPVSGAGSVQQRIAKAWPGDDRAVLAVASCESHFDPNATGAQGERGVLQIHPTHIDGTIAQLGFTWNDMYNVEANVAVGWSLSKHGTDWGPWTCRP